MASFYPDKENHLKQSHLTNHLNGIKWGPMEGVLIKH